MTETIRYGLIGVEDLSRGTGSFEVTLADGRVVILSQVNLVRLPSGLTSGSVPFVDTDEMLAEDTVNLLWDSTDAVLSVANITLLGGGVFRAVDNDAQLIHAFGTAT